MTGTVLYATTWKRPGPMLYISQKYLLSYAPGINHKSYEILSEKFAPGFYLDCGCYFKTESGVLFECDAYLSTIKICDRTGDILFKHNNYHVTFCRVPADKILKELFL